MLQGNCTTEIAQEYIAQFPATSPLLPLKPAQCLLLFTQSPLSVPPSANSDGELWLDNLYFRYIPPAGLGSTGTFDLYGIPDDDSRHSKASYKLLVCS